MVMMFSAGELSDMRDAQEGHMMDICLLAEPSKTTDPYNLPKDSWNWNAAVESACGFYANPGKELLDQVPEAEAVVRLPIDLALSHQARLRVIQRFGEVQADPVTYDVIGTPRLGPSGLLVWLKKVTDGSDG